DASAQAVGPKIMLATGLGADANVGSAQLADMPDGGFVAVYPRSTLNSVPSGQPATATQTLYVTRYDASGNQDDSGDVALDDSQVNDLDVAGVAGEATTTDDTSLKSTPRGSAGADTIFGESNDDRIIGGIGNDSVWGGDGSDRIYREDGRDSCYGNGGNDRIE